MRVCTKAYGEIDVDPRQHMHFPLGLFGFEDHEEWVLLDAKEQPFYWLQSLSSEQVAFVLIDPRIFRPDYQLSVPPEDLEEIEATADDQVLVFAIVTIPDQMRDMTANLQGPVVINRRTRVGRQAITSDPRWRVRHQILEEMATVG